jgi:hypothetical protein
MNRRAARMTMRLFLQIVGGIALLAWLLQARENVLIKRLAAMAAALLLVGLYGILIAMERRRLRREIAERICTVSFVRAPRWNNRPIEKYTLRGPAVKALMARHNQTVRDVESALLRSGYRRKDTRKAIETGRYEHGMHSYEALLQFALKELSGEHTNTYRIGDVPAVEGEATKPAPKARAAGR